MSPARAHDPALALMLRTLGERLADQPCPGCGRPLSGSRLTLGRNRGRPLARLICAGCGEGAWLVLEPDEPSGPPSLR